MTAPADPVQAQLGDRVYLGTRLANVHFYGDVSDIDTPGATTATMEMVGDDAVVTMDALVGPKGNDGEMAPIVRMQYGSPIDSLQELEELANTLTDTPTTSARPGGSATRSTCGTAPDSRSRPWAPPDRPGLCRTSPHH